MPAVISNKFRIHNASQFIESLSEVSNTALYFYLGGVSPYADELNPPSPGTTPANTDIDPWSSIFALKRVQSGDVSHVIKRYDWASGTVYDQYEDKGVNATDILTSEFYVMTDEYNVYKCLFNNNGASSVNKPTGTSATTIQTADGYKWKYMYSVSTSDALKFLTSSHIPVKTLTSNDGSDQWTVQQAAATAPDAIDIVLLESPGSGYVSAPTVTAIGDGTGATFSATVNVGTGQVTGINVLTRGTGYRYLTLSFSGGGPAGGAPTTPAVARAIISPKGGHGSDPVKELGGVFVLMNVRLDGNEANTFPVTNDFRQIGLITDPTLYGTSTVGTASVYRQTFKYQMTGITGTLARDAVVSYGSNTAVIVDTQTVGGNTFIYTTLPKPRLFQVGNNLSTSVPVANGTISLIETPSLNPYSGNIIYIENRVATGRSQGQIEDVKLIVEF